MKKAVIGSVIMITGAVIDLTLIFAASLYLPRMSEWRGLRLWFAIFGSRDLGDAVESLSVGVPFIIGLILFVTGFIILAIEYFKPDKR